MTISAAELTRRVKTLARTVGFDLVGIARAEPSRQLAAFRAWVAAGCAGEQGYLARPEAAERRADPRPSLPTARSVVVVGLNYAQPPTSSPSPSPSPESVPGEPTGVGSPAAAEVAARPR